MKRKNKNILMCSLLVIFVGLMIFSICVRSNRISSVNINMMPEGNNPPQEMNNGSDGTGGPPELPENDSNLQQGNQELPPDKPDDSEETPPDIPGGNQSDMTPPAFPNGENNDFDPVKNQIAAKSLETMDYVVFVSEGLVISVIVVYLFLSRFNKKSFKESFDGKDKVYKMIISVMVLTGAILFSDKFITEAVASNKSVSNFAGMGSNDTGISYKGKTEINSSKTITEGSYDSNSSDENAILITGNIDVDLNDISVVKNGDSSGGDTTSFYGINSAILAKDGAVLNISNASIETNAVGANGVFSYGGSATTNNTSKDSTTVNISDSEITTTKDNSGGIMTTGGGITNASNLTVLTLGTSSAAIRSDRGGGVVNVDGGSYTTNGKGSPAVYSTADITVKNAELNSTASEGLIIEGKNSITLENSALSSSNTHLNGLSTTYKNIFIYQSMSGDAAEGMAVLNASNNTITTYNGDSIYVTNTRASIYLKNNIFTNYDTEGNFLRIQKDSWGNDGQNGGDVSLDLEDQSIAGNIVVDSLSTLSVKMKNSYYEGVINCDDTAKEIVLKLDSSSRIKLTGDCFISEFENEDKTNSNIDFNGFNLYVNGMAIN